MSVRVAIGTSSFGGVDSSPLELLANKGIDIVPNPFARKLTENEIIEHLQGVDGLLAGLEPLNRKVISSTAPRLRAIARVGIGVANVDFDAAKDYNVKVSNTPDGPTDAVAEMTITAMLSLSRNLLKMNSALHANRWEKNISLGLNGTSVLLIGYGRIGQRVGELLRAFNAKILVVDPQIDAGSLKYGEQLVSLETGLQQAQIISLHAGGTETILAKEQFALMQDGVILLNAARGEVIEELALVEALDSGRIASAWLDVFWKEPYTGQLQNYDQVLLTPHISTYTRRCRLVMEMAAVRNLLRDLDIT